MIPTQQNLRVSHFFMVKGKVRRGSRKVKVLKPKVDLRRLWTVKIPKKNSVSTLGSVWKYCKLGIQVTGQGLGYLGDTYGKLVRSGWKRGYGVAVLGSRVVSKFFRRIFENPKIRTLVGAHLAVLTLLTGLVRAVPAMALGVIPEFGVAGLNREIDLTTKEAVVKPMGRYQLTQGFSIFHPGIDLAADTGEQIHPVMKGVVAEAGWSFFGYGNTIVLDHQNGYSSRYAHMSVVFVHEGDKVNTSTVLGLSGNTGRATGPHLHLEVQDHGIPVNPRNLLE